VQLALQDVKLHADRAHRGAGELEPMCRRAFSGAVLLSGPRICEPILRVSIEAPSSMSGVVRQLVASLRGRVELEEPRAGLPLSIITAMVPAIEAFGMDAKLSKATSGEGFPSSEFSHWR
jgi:translation elongation factor EF-G